MNIALIGYGAMGKIIERLAEGRGHAVTLVVDENDAGSGASELAAKLGGVDVAIDFSVSAAVQRNVEACVQAGVPLVEGTTGWSDRRKAIESFVIEGGGAFLYGANFSIGVNL